MLAYIVRRLGYALLMVVLVSFVSFIIIELPPGDALTQELARLEALGDKGAEERIEILRERYAMDKPVLTRYLNWATNFVKGDFGHYFFYDRPVNELIGERLALTITLVLATIGLTWLVAIPIGVYSATHQYSPGDQFF
ncbi:MAG: ABC transporter permease, partial [Chloroflexota bacterium]|nr:ABC transporter permease [Chloroflexota bacterium]